MHTNTLEFVNTLAKKHRDAQFYIDMNDAVIGIFDHVEKEVMPILAGTINGWILPYHNTLINGVLQTHTWTPIIPVDEVQA
jgi:hypothetical protein